MKLSRRKLLTGAAATAMAAGIGAEYWSLSGHGDHRRAAGRDEEGFARFREARAAVAKGAEGVIHIGHSTHLIALGGMTILTDPWFYDPAFGALSHAKRPPILPADLATFAARLDAIVITHDHADHVDRRALAEIRSEAFRGPRVYVPTEQLAKDVSVAALEPCLVKPGESFPLGPLVLHVVEGLHDIYEVGFVIAAREKSVYFGGDTALHGAMEGIGKTFAPTMAILPCDGTRLTGGALHTMRPEDAVVAAARLGARVVVPSHAEAYFSDPFAGTVLASTEKDAVARLHAGIEKDLPGVRCAMPRAGEFIPL